MAEIVFDGRAWHGEIDGPHGWVHIELWHMPGIKERTAYGFGVLKGWCHELISSRPGHGYIPETAILLVNRVLEHECGVEADAVKYQPIKQPILAEMVR